MISGFLIIGDPQVSSSYQGKRRDSFMDTSLDKLAQTVEVANKRNLLPLILGDIVDNPKESNLVLMSRLFKIFKAYRHKPLVIPGNHDLTQLNVAEGSLMELMASMELMDLIGQGDTMKTEFRDFELDSGRHVRIYGVPYGQEIPKQIHCPDGFTGVMMTHCDLAFDGAYPGAIEMFAVDGCEWIFNGHMHLLEPVVTHGQTRWFNPGNIVRMKTSDRDHIPSVWEWRPELETCLQHVLNYEKDVFHFVGVEPLQPDSTIQPIEFSESVFIENLQASVSSELPMTKDASALREDVAHVISQAKKSDGANQIFMKLYETISAQAVNKS